MVKTNTDCVFEGMHLSGGCLALTEYDCEGCRFFKSRKEWRIRNGYPERRKDEHISNR